MNSPHPSGFQNPETFLDSLNPAQRHAVEALDGPVMVLAGAGSGKTRVITYRIAWLVLQGRAPLWQILAVTFTNKAAGEMRHRVLSLLELPSESHFPIGTFHSRCAAILRREAVKIGLSSSFQILDEDDQLAAMKEVIKQLELDPKVVKPAQVLEVISNAKSRMLPPEELGDVASLQGVPYVKIYEGYEELLRKNNAVDFDDLMIKTVRLFEEDPQVLEFWRRRYPYILVDEYQDTNAVQFRLLELLAGEHRNICVVGDEDQSIYSWRGADISNLLDFQERFPGSQIVRLEENYRSTPQVLDCANSVISRNKRRLGKRLFTSAPAGPPVTLLRLSGGTEEAEWVVRRIRELHQAEGIPLNQFAVFYRIGSLSRVVEDQLRYARIPYKVIGGVKFYERKEIKDLTAYLRLVTNLENDLAFARVFNEPKRGLGERALSAFRQEANVRECSLFNGARWLLENDMFGGKSGAALQKFVDLISRLNVQWREMEPEAILKEIIKETAYIESLGDPKSIDAVSRTENVKELVNTLAQWRKDYPEGTLDDWLEQIALMTATDNREGAENGVSLMTLHAAKGLEFDVVFLVGCEEPLFPLGRVLEESGGDDEEERRLFYVGVTRARKRLNLTCATYRMVYGQTMPNMPSRFLREITPTVFEGGRHPLDPKPRAPGAPGGGSAYGSGGASGAGGYGSGSRPAGGSGFGAGFMPNRDAWKRK